MALEEIQVFQLGVEAQFQRLTEREKRLAHHMARAAWSGARVILQQVSPESIAIFDFILELHRTCSGDWDAIVDADVSSADLHRFLTYAATFLSNIGNYFGSGDQKFIPDLDAKVLQKLAARSSKLSELYQEMSSSINAIPPFSLGYPSQATQSSYYLGSGITEQEVAMVSRVLEQNAILPENTRIRKAENGADFEVLLASVQSDSEVQTFILPDGKGSVKIVLGDHSSELGRICAELSEAIKYTANDLQSGILGGYIESFQNGSLNAYRASQRLWVRDRAPRVESVFGFVEPYRDPHGIRSEFEALVGIADEEETKLLSKLVEKSPRFIRRLPWVGPDNDGNGPFEKTLPELPDITSIHALAYCSSIIFPGINLPNYNDIRQEDGFKNLIIANRMVAESQAKHFPFIDPSEREQFRKHKFPAYYWWVVLHECLGHGTGRMLVELDDGKYNFDKENPPINPLNGERITSWYKRGQTWTGQFADLATTLDECRAELVGAYLMDDAELLELLGFSETSEIRAEDLTYNLYQQLGVDGLRGLSNFNVDSNKWGQAHSRAHFAMLKCLLLDGNGVVAIIHDKPNKSLTVRVDKSKIADGKRALGGMLLRLHIYRCTADVDSCRAYYEGLSKVKDEHLEWRQVVLANKPPPSVFVHGNTFLDGETVTLKEYEPTVRGIIESWVERKV